MTGLKGWLQDFPGKHLLRVAAFFDLCGADGRLSFAKLVLVTLLAGWMAGRPLEAALAFVFVGASYGWKWVRLRTASGDSDGEHE
ncbi:MAG: hypothetical protein WEA80_01920 [Gemmatimonadaceae bacterium]